MKIIIIDGSGMDDECFHYVKGLKGNYEIYQVGYNIGHGNGMDYAIRKVKTEYALIMDSDIIMTKSPLEEMITWGGYKTYGVGWVTQTGRDGYDYGTWVKHGQAIPYLHPYFMLLNIDNYGRFHKFVHHGAPGYKAMNDIFDKNCSCMLKQSALITGHTRGKGANWEGKSNDYIIHDFGGTRENNKMNGKKEIIGTWER